MSLRQLIKFAIGNSDDSETPKSVRELNSPINYLMRQMSLVSKRALSRHAYNVCKIFPSELEPLSESIRDQLRKDIRKGLLESTKTPANERLLVTTQLLEQVGGRLNVYEEIMAELIRMHVSNLAIAGQIDNALSLLEQVLIQYRERVGCFNRLYGMLLQEHGRILSLANRASDGAAALLEATDVLILSVGPHALPTILATQNLGRTLHETGQLHAAMSSYNDAEAWLDELDPENPNHERLPEVWLSRSCVRFDLGDLAGSRMDAQKSRGRFEAAGQSFVRQFAEATSILGRIADDTGDVDEAEKLYRESSKRMEDSGYSNYTGVAWTKLLLARLLIRRDSIDDAKTLLDAARAIYENANFQAKPVFAAVDDATARCLYSQGKPEQALTHAQNAIRITQASFGERAQQVVAHASNVGVLQLECDQLTEAAESLEFALDLLTNRPTRNLPAEALVRCNLALVAERNGDFEQARDLLDSSRADSDGEQRTVVLGNLLRILKALDHDELTEQIVALENANILDIPPTPILATTSILSVAA